MAVAIPGPPVLSPDLTLFHATDPLLANLPVLIFHGPAATIGTTSSRVQVHIFTAAGHQCYPRLAVSPNSPFYSAVSNLPREEQGDETCRGLAFGLKKYFAELSDTVKATWCLESKAGSPSTLFGDEHVAILATRMTKVENADEVTAVLQDAFAELRLPWLEVDVVLPPGSIKDVKQSINHNEELDENQMLHLKYGKYAELVASMGDTEFLPTSRVKRAPSKATSIGRTASFHRHQQEIVRKELNELLGTEISYLQRINELSELANTIDEHADATSQDKLRKLFPSTLGTIVQLNTEFLNALRSTVISAEESMKNDVEEMQDEQANTIRAWQDTADDTQGIGAVAACLLEWLPKFHNAYGEYLRCQAQCAQHLRDAMRGESSALSASLSKVGEQKLTSLLIEPVQRLPRYTLYIDTISKQLPVKHPAIRQLLRARDMVSEICDQKGLDTSAQKIVQKLSSRVSGWPRDQVISGRLVTACDFLEINAQYRREEDHGEQGILLLFTDCIVMVGRSGSAAINARSLLGDLEGAHALPKSSQSRPGTPQGLTYHRNLRLNLVSFLEGPDGRTLHMFTRTPDEENDRPSATSYRRLRLEGVYERKAERFIEEVTKARIEGRFTEAERETSAWEIRTSDPLADAATLLASIFDDSHTAHVMSRRDTAPIRLIVDIDRHTQKRRAGKDDIRIIACITPLRDGLWRITFDSIDGNINHEHVSVEEVIPTLRKRLSVLAESSFSIDQKLMTTCLLARNAEILQSIDIKMLKEEVSIVRQISQAERPPRPKSPRKFLTNFLSSTGAQSSLLLKKDLPPLPPPADGQRYTVAPQAVSPGPESRPSSRDQPTPKSTMSVFSAEHSISSAKKLERTLSSYGVALQARKGNIVGRSLTMRSAADELAVNEVYNGLLEDPNSMALAAQAPVDVLFAAFEKFLGIAWTDHFGPILPLPVLDDIRVKAETTLPPQFDAFFKTSLEALSAQNQCAFRIIMKLLADLLDGTGNDSDRGILTAAFAELLVPDGNSHDYIALIDRFVDDPDTYFGEPLDDVPRVNDGSTNFHKRSRSVNSASITSNTSSIRRKLGFGGPSKENFKPEQESKVASVLRSLSKTARGDASPGNTVSRGPLVRAHSTEAEARLISSRPSSQDGLSHKSAGFEDDVSFISVSSAHNLPLSTIGEHGIPSIARPPRKKRRSSLSDLEAFDESVQKSTVWSSPSPRRPLPPTKHGVDTSTSNTPLRSTPSSKDDSSRFGSAARRLSRPQLPPSFRKENSPSPSKSTKKPDLQETISPDDAVITVRNSSNIPTLTPRPASPQKGLSPLPGRGGGLFERRDAGNAVKKPSPSTSSPFKPIASGTTEAGSPRKLRVQSPQKLRDRIHNEQAALGTTQGTMRDELRALGNDLAATPSRVDSVRMTTTGQLRTSDLSARILQMEEQLNEQITDLQTRLTAIQADLSSSLSVSEGKCKRLDALYREANGENEALYARFNDELARVLSVVRGGEGVEELKAKLKESQDEVGKLKRENGRLKRENLGLRSQLKD